MQGDIAGDALVWTGRRLDADVPDEDRGSSAEVIVADRLLELALKLADGLEAAEASLQDI
jgi:hypothetical protein